VALPRGELSTTDMGGFSREVTPQGRGEFRTFIPALTHGPFCDGERGGLNPPAVSIVLSLVDLLFEPRRQLK